MATTLVVATLAVSGCRELEPDPAPAPDPARRTMPETALKIALDAHGGLERWASFGALEFDLRKGERTEHVLVDLHSRSHKLSGEGYSIGYNGRDMWIAPDSSAYPGNARFYSSLDFYFFSLPFVLADPGAMHEPVGRRVLGDETYDVVKVSFEPGTGESPDDYYYTHFDTLSGQLEFLLYTVTFGDGQPNEQYYGRAYEWQEVDGLTVPASTTSYRWDSEQDTLGQQRSITQYSNVTFRSERPDPAVFDPPAGSHIDPK